MAEKREQYEPPDTMTEQTISLSFARLRRKISYTHVDRVSSLTRKWVSETEP